MKIIAISVLAFYSCIQFVHSQINNTNEKNIFADHWQYIGVAVSEPGFTIWGSSPIIDNEKSIHLFVARWPAELKVDPGWRSHSEIAHYVGDSPEGPFRFSEISLQGTGKDSWDKFGAHNPAIHKVGDSYILLYIGNDNPNPPSHPSNQKIGMAISNSLFGPWEKVNGNGLILSPPLDKKHWNYNASNGVNNPALLQHPHGGYFLYFKSQGGKMGVAIAQHIEGPYVQFPSPITTNNQAVEDGYAFIYKNKICLLTTDNHGLIEKGGGILWSSEDGIHFNEKEQGFYPVTKYLSKEKLKNASKHYGGEIIKFERPQVLMIKGKPAYLYASSGYHFFGGESTVGYVLKFVID